MFYSLAIVRIFFRDLGCRLLFMIGYFCNRLFILVGLVDLVVCVCRFVFFELKVEI